MAGRSNSQTTPVPVAIIAGQLVVGGAERQLYLWLANLDRSKFSPVVLSLHPGHDDYWEEPVRELGIPLYEVPQQANRLSRLFEIIRILRPYHPALIQGWHLFASPYAAAAALLLGVKSLGGLRDMAATFWKHPVEARLTLWFGDAILANSKSAARDLEASRVRKRQQIFAVQNAVCPDFNSRSESRRLLDPENHISEKAIWIGTINRLDAKKRLQQYLQLAELYPGRDDIHFFLIGDGPQRSELETLANERGLRDILTFTGEIPMASRLLPAFDVFCFTSGDEGMPNVVLEAAAAAVPVIAWQYPFMEEVLTQKITGILIEPNEIGSFKDALDELIVNTGLREALGKSSQEVILQQFGLERYIQELTNVYDTLMKSRNRIKGDHE